MPRLQTCDKTQTEQKRECVCLCVCVFVHSHMCACVSGCMYITKCTCVSTCVVCITFLIFIHNFSSDFQSCNTLNLSKRPIPQNISTDLVNIIFCLSSMLTLHQQGYSINVFLQTLLSHLPYKKKREGGRTWGKRLLPCSLTLSPTEPCCGSSPPQTTELLNPVLKLQQLQVKASN